MKTLKKNSKDKEDVEILQHLLNYHRNKMKVDGLFGDETKRAVIAFQENHFDDKGHSLDPDGIVGNSTWRSLIDSDRNEDKKHKPVKVPKADSVTLKRIKDIHPSLTVELKEIYQEILQRGVNVRFAQVFRSFAQQDALYAKGRTAPGKKVTNARGGQSYHNYGLAVDIVLRTRGGGVSWDRALDQDGDGESDWEEIVAVFKDRGWKWGGDWSSFKDYPHFEKSFGFSTSQLRKRHDAGDFVKGEYVRLS